MSEKVVVVAGAEIAAGVGEPSLHGGEIMNGNPRHAENLNAQNYGNHLPQLWEYCRGLAEHVDGLKPSLLHEGLAKLNHPVITQNIGGMHRRAGSSEVIEVNGSVFTSRCIRCQREETITMEEYRNITPGGTPNCGNCGKNRVRPSIVLPGEKKHHRRKAEKLIADANVVVYVGVKPDLEDGYIDQWYKKTPYSVLVSTKPWGNFSRTLNITPEEWAAEGFPIH